jgi:hypothetical protein
MCSDNQVQKMDEVLEERTNKITQNLNGPHLVTEAIGIEMALYESHIHLRPFPLLGEREVPSRAVHHSARPGHQQQWRQLMTAEMIVEATGLEFEVCPEIETFGCCNRD